MSYYQVPAEIIQPLWEEFQRDRDAALERMQWITDLGGHPVAFSGWGRTVISGIKFDGEVPEGFRKHEGYWKPDKRTKAGKAWDAKLSEVRSVPDASAYFKRAGVPNEIWHGLNVSTPGWRVLKDGSLLVSVKEGVPWTAPATFKELKGSEYHALAEADEEARSEE